MVAPDLIKKNDDGEFPSDDSNESGNLIDPCCAECHDYVRRIQIFLVSTQAICDRHPEGSLADGTDDLEKAVSQ